jgi:hypothetical protein
MHVQIIITAVIELIVLLNEPKRHTSNNSVKTVPIERKKNTHSFHLISRLNKMSQKAAILLIMPNLHKRAYKWILVLGIKQHSTHNKNNSIIDIDSQTNTTRTYRPVVRCDAMTTISTVTPVSKLLKTVLQHP